MAELENSSLELVAVRSSPVNTKGLYTAEVESAAANDEFKDLLKELPDVSESMKDELNGKYESAIKHVSQHLEQITKLTLKKQHILAEVGDVSTFSSKTITVIRYIIWALILVACSLSALSHFDINPINLFSRLEWEIKAGISASLFLSALLFDNFYLKKAVENIQTRVKDNILNAKGFHKAEREIKALEEHITSDFKEYVKANARAFLNRCISVSYESDLRINHKEGLSDVSNTEQIVITKNLKALITEIEEMKEGTLGLSGQRGAGKTTLLEWVTKNHFSSLEKTHISVSLSAPIHYEARDFILHLFSKLCYEVLNKKANIKRQELSELERSKEEVDWNAIPMKRAAMEFAPLFLMFTGFAVFILPLFLIEPSSDGQFDQVLLSLYSVKGLPIQGPILMLLGFFMLINKERFLTAMFKDLPRTSKLKKRLERSILGESDQFVNRIFEYLKNIRFQQSYSKGWKGSLSVPFINDEQSSTETLALNQKTMPDIVDDIEEMIDDVGQNFDLNGPVIIAIDEMDKMKSLDDARKFLNDIKAIFSTKNCLYLVSVSEDAMSSFERRGLSFRDSFDSSFHDIIHVKYLDLEDSIQIINRRVIGLSRPFHALCHCLSGGLPRDLIRFVRKLAAFDNGTSMDKVSEKLFREEILKKLRAIRVTMQDLSVEDGFLQSAAILQKFELIDLEQSRMLVSELHSQIEIDTTRMTANIPTTVDDEARATIQERLDKICGLARELNSYTYFLFLLNSMFKKTQEESMFTENMVYEQIAIARQELGTNKGLALKRLQKIQSSNSIAGDWGFLT